MGKLFTYLPVNIILWTTTDENGAILVKYSYDPWGNVKSTDGTLVQPFRYAGCYEDDETGLYYLKSRYYSPTLGRFLTRDSYGYIDYKNPQTLNLYAYVKNNPVSLIDPTGNYDQLYIENGNSSIDTYDESGDLTSSTLLGTLGSLLARFGDWAVHHGTDLTKIGLALSGTGAVIALVQPEIGIPMMDFGGAIGKARFYVQLGAYMSGKDPSPKHLALAFLSGYGPIGTLSKLVGKGGLKLMGPALRKLISQADAFITNGIS